MRVYIKTTPNHRTVPFNYQANLVGALHKWIGENEIHDQISLYSLSWLNGGEMKKNGLDFPKGSDFFISSPDIQLCKRIITGIQDDPAVCFGMYVTEISLKETPVFTASEKFFLQSPVLIKRTINEETKYFFPEHAEANDLLTQTLKNKLTKIGFQDLNIRITFDQSYQKRKTKFIIYKGIDIKASLCPILIEGDPAAIAFAWDVGVGNSTGIGFGALK